MSAAAKLLLLHADMYRAGVEHWHSCGMAARALAGRLIAGDA